MNNAAYTAYFLGLVSVFAKYRVRVVRVIFSVVRVVRGKWCEGCGARDYFLPTADLFFIIINVGIKSAVGRPEVTVFDRSRKGLVGGECAVHPRSTQESQHFLCTFPWTTKGKKIEN